MRRSSTNSTETGTSNSASFMSMSSSFANSSINFANALALDLPLRYDDNTKSSSSIFNNSNNSSISGTIPLDNKQWADDRVERVTSNHRLNKLLKEEVQKAGVVTTAGYNAVLKKFIMSEEVEKVIREENQFKEQQQTRRKASSRRQRRNIMGRFAASITGSTEADVSKSWTEGKTNQDMNRRYTVSTNNDELLLGKSRTFSAYRRGRRTIDSSDTNIAPRKMESFRRDKREEIKRRERRGSNLQTYHESQAFSKEEDGSYDSLLSADDSSSASVSLADIISNPPTTAVGSNNAQGYAGNRRASTESLNLEQVFDGADGSKVIRRAHSVPSESNLGPLPVDIVDALDTLSVSFFKGGRCNHGVVLEHDDVEDATDITGKAAEEEDASLFSEGSDDCGWLPWPNKEEEDATDRSNSGCKDRGEEPSV
mmetsp:Transcript_3956/g.8726  ORF Transcript_3956/g.8726 Transcript_3956/m.8726 type:complete len:426 (-) Transcript_3956:218-1495(-)